MNVKGVPKLALKVFKVHGFVLLVGLVASSILGEDNFSKLVGEPPKGFWFWAGSYLLGVVILWISFVIDKLRQRVCGRGEDE
jgi:uncharacterized membrane protein